MQDLVSSLVWASDDAGDPHLCDQRARKAAFRGEGDVIPLELKQQTNKQTKTCKINSIHIYNQPISLSWATTKGIWRESYSPGAFQAGFPGLIFCSQPCPLDSVQRKDGK